MRRGGGKIQGNNKKKLKILLRPYQNPDRWDGWYKHGSGKFVKYKPALYQKFYNREGSEEKEKERLRRRERERAREREKDCVRDRERKNTYKSCDD